MRHQARLETLPQALFDAGELARQPIAGEHELTPRVVEGVERVEELLLGLRLAGEELDVVDQEDVDVSVEMLEALERLSFEGRDEAVRERLHRRVTDCGRGLEGGDVVRDRVQEMRLPESGWSVQEQRVIGLTGRLGDGERGRVRQAVPVADHELVEGVTGVEVAQRGSPLSRPCGRSAPWAASAGSPAKATLTPAPNTAWTHFSSTRP